MQLDFNLVNEIVDVVAANQDVRQLAKLRRNARNRLRYKTDAAYREGCLQRARAQTMRRTAVERAQRSKKVAAELKGKYQTDPAYSQKKRRQMRANKKRKFCASLGLSPADYNAMLVSQRGRCANRKCQARLDGGKHTHLDHCHQTGKVRGVLCANCNKALGFARDSAAILVGLVAYLKAAY